MFLYDKHQSLDQLLQETKKGDCVHGQVKDACIYILPFWFLHLVRCQMLSKSHFYVYHNAFIQFCAIILDMVMFMLCLFRDKLRDGKSLSKNCINCAKVILQLMCTSQVIFSHNFTTLLSVKKIRYLIFSTMGHHIEYELSGWIWQ
jgi:hypothetical protein